MLLAESGLADAVANDLEAVWGVSKWVLLIALGGLLGNRVDAAIHRRWKIAPELWLIGVGVAAVQGLVTYSAAHKLRDGNDATDIVIAVLGFVFGTVTLLCLVGAMVMDSGHEDFEDFTRLRRWLAGSTHRRRSIDEQADFEEFT